MSAPPIRILGPLLVNDRELRLPQQAQVLLGVLLLRVNEVVSAQRLADEIWGERPPASWVNAVQVYVSRVRKAFAEAEVEGGLRRHGPGYVLELPADAVDAVLFERLARSAAGLVARDPAGAVGLLQEALSLWRGQALEGLSFEGLASIETERLHERRLLVVEQRLELELGLGRHREVVPELEQLVGEHPFRERLWCMLIVALYRSGRQVDALAECRRARELLVEELGLEPGEELHALEGSVLRQDPSLAPPVATEDSRVSPAPVARARRPVTAVSVCADASVLDELDPEVVEIVGASWQLEAERVLGERGATLVETSVGAVVGLFGLPHAHEDDALRACRAALALADVLSAAGPGVPPGLAVEAGEVMVGEDHKPRGGLLAAVERLAADAGEVLLGPRVSALVRDSVNTRTRHGRVRLVGVERAAEAIARDLTRPLVGRLTELELLGRLFERSLEAGQAGLAVVSGPAGIGKSRLVAEFVRAMADRATVVQARCLPDEAGLAFAPLAEPVRELFADRGRKGLLALVAAEDDPDEIVARVLSLAGAESPLTSSREEIFRAARKLLEALALERPVLLVVEDLHWAEPVLLDLLEELAGANSPLVVTGTARPALLGVRTAWAGEHPRWSSVALGPLPESDCVALLDGIRSDPLDEPARARIVGASAGNPLFLEQLAAMESDWTHGTDDPPVPSSLRGLLLARLDRLDPVAQTVLENASILSEPFQPDELGALTHTSDQADLERVVRELARREYLRQAPGGDLAFAHPLIRTTVYETLPKRRRAELHEQVAALAQATRTGVIVDELVGHHLERAFRCRVELGRDDPRLPELAARARERLGAAGRRRYEQGDVTTAVSLLSRARSSTLDERDVPAGIPHYLGDALRETGRLEEAERMLREAVDLAFAGGDEPLGWRAQASLVRVLLQLPGHPVDEVRALADETLAQLTRLGDEEGLAVVWWAQGWLTWLECRAADTETALTRSMGAARAAGNLRLEAHSVNLYLGAALFGPMPVEHAIERCLEFRRRHHDRQLILASCARALAVLRAMQGEFGDARSLIALDTSIIAELGMRYQAATAVEAYGLVELLAGEPAQAERFVRAGYAQLTRMGDTSSLPTVAALLGETLIALERYDDALLVTNEARVHTDPHDLGAQIQWRCAHAKALAWQGRDKRAQRTALDAVQLAERTDFLNLHADALTTLAEVNRLAGRTGDTIAALTQAARLYKQKGNKVAAARANVALRAARRDERLTLAAPAASSAG